METITGLGTVDTVLKKLRDVTRYTARTLFKGPLE